ncbi:MAG: type I-U CRISPR-associated helicase/endonuclease Cas3 [Acidimicrobiia bacterium]|nr:type I-U CRISPR-associated helicase/endonuclease Cas3 [Acidimicrobiia bacterium]MYC58243.1 type I-U CRISPR-associated helicase/endonuclease Cas3 [Acidimicrobiia bacterium]MYI30115.1 type I-U CRISPR-associated helicase/endonuclease Cas3 [Acidimicrobiia bacterium]
MIQPPWRTREMSMADLRVDDFRTYFRNVHGHDPFPWQHRLTAQVLEEGQWPEVIDLPTGTGKTAVLDTAVFALAARPEVFPRRVVFVIDRRIVVDQVVKRAQIIQSKVQGSSDPVMRLIKDRLREIGGESLLGVVALRGGIPIDGEWARRPDEPWVMVSTVDQFGSRLLFRGYGVSPKMRPIHAGLAGNDCLVILDEVHLSRAFAQTLQEVSALSSNGLLPKRFQVVEMSATPTNPNGHQAPFRLTEDDLAGSYELRRRAWALKSATLWEAGTKQPHIAIPAEVKKILKSHVDESIRSVGVIVNRVRTARETYQTLQDAGYSAHLITGRMRPLDKVRSLEAISGLVDPDSQSEGEGLTVVVATQAIEVGADFSFDALITEAAPIDSLRQRFGRLDRRGTLAERTGRPARAWIVGAKSVLSSKKPDPVYGDSTRATWEELQRLEGFEASIDFSPCSEILYQLPDECAAPVDQAPLLLSTYMDAWVQTNPEPVIQPAVDWFLHGIEQEPQVTDVSIVWRYDRSLQALREVPLRPAEFLQVPINAAKAWLGGVEEEVPVADVNGSSSEEIKGLDSKVGSDWCRWQGYDEDSKSISVSDIQPGDVLVVDPACGGISGGTWDPGSTEPVADLGDEAQHAYGHRFTLRFDERLCPQEWPKSPDPADEAAALEPLSDRIESWLAEVDSRSGLTAWQREVIRKLQVGHEVRNLNDGYYVLISGRIDSSTLDGSDQFSSFIGSGVTLRDHLSGVGMRAAAYARRLGMSEAIQSDLELAAKLHDLGKVDSRFQKQMVGDDEVRQAMQDEPLAKSLPGARPSRGGWPPVRHEIMSVAMAQSNPEVLAGAHDPDLVLHLVGTHHGHARPLPPIKEDQCPQVLCFDHEGIPVEASTDLVDGPLALEMADRFWRLIERYGYHGLAWLEAILRLADHQQSAEEAKR